ncbi:MAG TPA: 5-(carboxyamino)imidazole ribonucleotide mutase [Pyrinomonadaceae bacterium]|nr:5-(carboxyamino)imidazole ribonucleotide mutase [Pyrinomonadaceae bacterium]
MATKKRAKGRKPTKRKGTPSPNRAVPASPRHPVSASPPLVAIVMGSQSDWETMRSASETLQNFGVPHECRVISAHRSPQLAVEFSSAAESKGFEVIIAAAGGAAHLAGVFAAHTTLPVLGVPMKSEALKGLDSLLSTVQMPAGIPVASLAIGKPGATNAALFAIAILANSHPQLREKLWDFRREQEKKIRATELT